MIKRFELRPTDVSDEAFNIYSNSDYIFGIDEDFILYLKGNGWEKIGSVADVEEFLKA